MKIRQASRYYRKKSPRDALSYRFVMDRSGDFEAAYRFLELRNSEKAKQTERNWYPNLGEWVALQVMYNRTRAFLNNSPGKERFPKMGKSEFAGLLQYVYENRTNVNENFIWQPTSLDWHYPHPNFPDGMFPLWDPGCNGRPPRPQEVTQAITQLDAEVLAQFLSEKPKKDFPWDVWLASGESVKRIVQIVTYCADALTEEVTPEGVAPINITSWCNRQRREGETYPTRFLLNTVRGRVTLPVRNSIPAFNLEGP